MKKYLIIPIIAAISTLQATADVTWNTDYEKAIKQAQSENKLLLILFTGSDWCPPCMQMHKNVFTQDQFADKVKNDFVLVELDFPNNKPQAAELKEQNKKLSEKYSIQGFPTVVFARADGKPIARLVGGAGMEDMITFIDKALEKAAAPDDGKELSLNGPPILDETSAAQIAEFEEAIGKLDGQDKAAALTLVNGFLTRKDLTNTTRHIVLFFQGSLYLENNKPTDAIKSFEESAKLDSLLKNEIGKLIEVSKVQLDQKSDSE